MAKTKNSPKSKKTTKTSKAPSFFNKRNILIIIFCLSIAVNLVFVSYIGVVYIQSRRGHVLSVMDDNLLNQTCQNYFVKNAYKTGQSTIVNGITFSSVYLSSDQQKNICNNLPAFSYDYLKTLLETNNSAAINYYVKTTKLDTGYLASHPENVVIPVFYDSSSKTPINVDTQDIHY